MKELWEKRLNYLLKRKLISVDDKGLYMITDKGRHVLDKEEAKRLKKMNEPIDWIVIASLITATLSLALAILG